jgi:hypothetical protein
MTRRTGLEGGASDHGEVGSCLEEATRRWANAGWQQNGPVGKLREASRVGIIWL